MKNLKSGSIFRVWTLFMLIIVGSGYWFVNDAFINGRHDILAKADVEQKTIATLPSYLDLYFHTGNVMYVEMIRERLEIVSDIQHDIDASSLANVEVKNQSSRINAAIGEIAVLLHDFEKKGAKYVEPRYQRSPARAEKHYAFSTEDAHKLEDIRSRLYGLQARTVNLYDDLGAACNDEIGRIRTGANATLAAGLILIAAIYFITRAKLLKPLTLLAHYASDIAAGNFEQRADIGGPDVAPAKRALDRIAGHIKDATDFAVKVGEGNLDISDQSITADDFLGKALIEMRNKLSGVAEEENKRNWAMNGVARFGEIFRHYQHSGLEELSYQFIFNLVKYVDANQGGVFLLNNENPDDEFIEAAACYAYERRKQLEKRIEKGEGLVGQCILEKDVVYVEEVPAGYVNITSGLGGKTPTCILVAPLKVNDEIFGAVELAFFNLLPSHQIKFVESVCETFASTLSGAKMTLRTQRLLEESQAVNEELQRKEEEMRQNAEELQATQEELNRKLREIEEETNLSKNIVDAINKTNATIEFDMTGAILDVNDMYLSVMGYTREELIGRNEIELAPADEIDSQRYQMLWDSLNSGNFMSGEYRRLSKGGREVWLNGTYNPIFNLEGKPYKVIQFAQFTTEEKEKDLDMAGKINAISGAFPVIELDASGRIKNANQEFINEMGYLRKEFREKELGFFFAENAASSLDFTTLLSGEEKATSTIIAWRTKEGRVKHFLTICNAIRNLSGEICKLMIILVDFSRQKDLESELSEKQKTLSATAADLEKARESLTLQENELRAHINLLNKATNIFELNTDGLIVDANEAACKLFKAKKKELIGDNIGAYVANRDDLETLRRLRDEIAHGSLARETIKYKDAEGAIIWGDTTIAPVMGKDNAPVKIMVVMFDVSAQAAVENDLRESLAREKVKNALFRRHSSDNDSLVHETIMRMVEKASNAESLRKLLHSGAFPSLRIDGAGKALEISALTEKLLGVSREYAINMPVDELLRSNNAALPRHLLDRMLKGAVVNHTLPLETPSGARETTLLSMPLFAGPDSELNILIFLLSPAKIFQKA